jgi:flagellar FliL protein
MYDMKPFHLNLGNPLENRYVRLEIRLEYPNEEQRPELIARDSQLRDAIVSIVSRKTREHLLSPDGKDQLRLEIKNRVNQYLEKKVNNVYITDILIE